jgi:putative Ca2+/H+ antiporter (TMEM165/GDT1 family)
MRPYLVIFLSVLLAELGDKTQLATIIFATNAEIGKMGVFAAAAAALVTSSLLAVLVGSQLGHWLPTTSLRPVAGVGFIAIGLWMLLVRA